MQGGVDGHGVHAVQVALQILLRVEAAAGDGFAVQGTETQLQIRERLRVARLIKEDGVHDQGVAVIRMAAYYQVGATQFAQIRAARQAAADHTAGLLVGWAPLRAAGQIIEVEPGVLANQHSRRQYRQHGPLDQPLPVPLWLELGVTLAHWLGGNRHRLIVQVVAEQVETAKQAVIIVFLFLPGRRGGFSGCLGRRLRLKVGRFFRRLFITGGKSGPFRLARRFAGRGVVVLQLLKQRFCPGFVCPFAMAGASGPGHVGKVFSQIVFVVSLAQVHEGIAQFHAFHIQAIGIRLVRCGGGGFLPGRFRRRGRRAGVIVQSPGPTVCRFTGGLFGRINQMVRGLKDLQAGTTANGAAGLLEVFVRDLELGCTVGAARLVLGGHGFA